MMPQVVLHLGSNLPWRNRHLLRARGLLQERLGTEVRASAVYETGAWGVADQPDFLNQACLYETTLTPAATLAVALDIEAEMGRRRLRKWGTRRIDIDLIFYADEVVNTPTLTLPHPWLHARRFVLVPLAEIVRDWRHPVMGKTVRQLLATCEDEGRVVRVC